MSFLSPTRLAMACALAFAAVAPRLAGFEEPSRFTF